MVYLLTDRNIPSLVCITSDVQNLKKEEKETKILL